MIKFPNDVRRILTTLQNKGLEGYAVGECVRDSICGLKPTDWDIATNADIDALKELFPEAEVISEKYQVVRMPFVETKTDPETGEEYEEGIVVDVARYRESTIYLDGRKQDEVVFSNTIEDDLKRRDFTINAMADNGIRFVDPYAAKTDTANKIIKTIGNADESFKDNPIRMLKAIHISADLGFDLSKQVFEAITGNYRLINKIPMDKFRDEFTDIMSAAHAGKGFSLIMDTGLINLVLDDKSVKHLTNREKSDLMMLSENIDRSKQIPERRLGLFYSAINKRKGIPSIEKFGFDEFTTACLIDAVKDLPRLYFCSQENQLKKFVYEHGWDRSNYLLNLEKAQRIVFNLDSQMRIEGRAYFLREIANKNEPIFPEDLAIDANDLIEAGICDDVESAKDMLKRLVEACHNKPQLNVREQLIAKAKKFKKNKIASYFRRIDWLH